MNLWGALISSTEGHLMLIHANPLVSTLHDLLQWLNFTVGKVRGSLTMIW